MTDAEIKNLRDVMATTQEDLDRLAAEAAADAEANAAGDYSEDDGQIIRTTIVRKKLRSEAMTNFTCRIVEDREISLGDDAPPDRKYLMRVYPRGKAPKEFEINASEFKSLNWVEPKIGSDALIEPTTEKSLPHAIKSLSQSAGVKKVKTIGHMGWARIGGVDVYVMPSGAIGPAGWTPPEGVNFAPPTTDKLGEFRWPTQDGLASFSAAHKVQLVEKTMSILKVGTSEIGLALGITPFRAILDSPSETTLWFMGPGGGFKSATFALLQQFWMPSAIYNNPFATFVVTANKLERQGFDVKDALMWVDEFTFSTVKFPKDLDTTGDRLVRAYESRTGRGRLNRNSEVMIERPPRGSLAVSGEDVITAPSGRARLWLIEIRKGTIDFGTVEALSALGRKRVFTIAAAMFAQWLATLGLSAVRKRFRDDRAQNVKDMRDKLAGSPLQRHITAWAGAKATARIVQAFCIAHGHDPGLTDAYIDQCLQGAQMTAAVMTDAHDGRQTLALLAGVINSRNGHIASRNTGGLPFRVDPPTAGVTGVPNPIAANEKGRALGWTYEGFEWRPKGRLVGWIDESNPKVVYINQAAGYDAYAEAARAQGLTPLSQSRIGRELRSEGLLAEWDGDAAPGEDSSRSLTRNRKTIRVANGPPIRTWAVAYDNLFGVDGDA